MRLTQQTVNELYELLSRPIISQTRRSQAPIPTWASIADRRFVKVRELADVLSASDARLVHLNIARLASQIGFQVNSVFQRDARGRLSAISEDALTEAEAVAMLIFMKQMSFMIDPMPAVTEMLPRIQQMPSITRAELGILRFSQKGGKQSRLVLEPYDADYGDDEPQFIDSRVRGYVLEVTLHGVDVQRLVLQSTRWRSPATRPIITCPQCGYQVEQGDRHAASEHRRVHARWLKLYEPRPSQWFGAEVGQSLIFVTRRSRKVLHQAMFERALEFKRNGGFDWTQWLEPRGYQRELRREGVLFISADGRIDGAAAFAPSGEGQQERHMWILDWVWVRPGARRSGVLARAWPHLMSKFGDFGISNPVSESMAAFLARHGTARQRLAG